MLVKSHVPFIRTRAMCISMYIRFNVTVTFNTPANTRADACLRAAHLLRNNKSIKYPAASCSGRRVAALCRLSRDDGLIKRVSHASDTSNQSRFNLPHAGGVIRSAIYFGIRVILSRFQCTAILAPIGHPLAGSAWPMSADVSHLNAHLDMRV